MNWLTQKAVWRGGIGFLTIAIIQTYSLHRSLLAIEKNNNTSVAAAIADPQDESIYKQILDYAEEQNLANSSMGNIVQAVAEQFLGAEYQAGLLDRTVHETLVISLQQFDCLLFIETVLAIANNIASQDRSYQALRNKIEEQRYWQGKMNGYCSRLHYFSDWIEDNQKRGHVTNITPRLGGIKIVKKLDFMTNHRDSYPSLAKSDRNFNCISRVEDSLSTKFTYIPTQNIKQTYAQLQPGDLIGVATKIEGLDFTHTGFAYQQPNGKIGLIHASPAGQVVIAQDLQKYIQNVPQAIGIVVSRANKPQ